MQKSSINPLVLDELFNSASNAAAKGQAQWFTPVKFAQQLAAGLPRYRPIITDLTCGNGSLLKGVANKSTERCQGIDIDPCALVTDRHISRITGDLTVVYPLLDEVGWTADLFALNPPWDLHWYRDRLTGLAESPIAAVRAAFEAHDGRTSRETIDSTVATLMIALDRCTARGEGFLIGNESTLQRLILGEGAPHGDLAMHVWAHLVVDGNPCMDPHPLRPLREANVVPCCSDLRGEGRGEVSTSLGKSNQSP